MQAIAINFAKRPRSASKLGVALCLFGAGAICMAAWSYIDAQAEVDQAQTRLARLQRPKAAPRPSAAATSTANVARREDDKSFTRVSTQLRRPWSGLLGEIEASSTPAVALTSVESQGQTRTLHMSGEAKTMADVVAYVNRLRQLPHIESVYLSQHEEKQSAGGVGVIRFSLDAVWRPLP